MRCVTINRTLRQNCNVWGMESSFYRERERGRDAPSIQICELIGSTFPIHTSNSQRTTTFGRF